MKSCRNHKHELRQQQKNLCTSLQLKWELSDNRGDSWRCVWTPFFAAYNNCDCCCVTLLNHWTSRRRNRSFQRWFLNPSSAASLTRCRSDSGGSVSKPPEEGQADVLLHPLPFLQHAQDILLRRQGKTSLLSFFTLDKIYLFLWRCLTKVMNPSIQVWFINRSGCLRFCSSCFWIFKKLEAGKRSSLRRGSDAEIKPGGKKWLILWLE